MPKNIVKRAAEFCALPKFERVFDDFARDHADAFLDAVEAKGGEVEHKHEYKELHDKYLQLFEAELSDFVESEGSSIDEFFTECREIFDGQYTALFEEHQYAWFVDHLLACMDYKHFYGLMVNEARRQSRNSHRHYVSFPPFSATNQLPFLLTNPTIMVDDRVFVWGSGGAGQLGLSNTDDFAVPQELLIHTKEIVPESIVTGGCHTAGLTTQGALYLWGDNEKLQLARPREILCVQALEPLLRDASLTTATTTTTTATTNARVRVVACGWSHTVAVTTTAHSKLIEEEEQDEGPVDQVWTWGANDHHQLARSATSDTPAHVPQVVSFPALSSRGSSDRRVVVSVSCGWKHSLLALDDGSVFSWGSGRHGELGLGSSTLVALEPTRLVSFDHHHHHNRIDKVYCGWQHSMFHSTSSGFVYACGNNRHGQLGVSRASEPSRSTPAQVFLPPTEADPRDPLRASQIDVGWHFTLCISTDNTLYSWGKGAHGQLGHGTFENVELPTRVAFDQRVQQIACGSEHSMVVTQIGDLYTCGWGEHGNLGHGDTGNKSQLTKIPFFSDQNLYVHSIAAGGAVSIARTRPL